MNRVVDMVAKQVGMHVAWTALVFQAFFVGTKGKPSKG